MGIPAFWRARVLLAGLEQDWIRWTRARTHPQGQLLPLGARGLARKVGDTGPHHRYTGPELRRGVRRGSLPSGCLCLAQSGIPQIRVEGPRLLQERTAQQMGQRAGRPAHPARAYSEECAMQRFLFFKLREADLLCSVKGPLSGPLRYANA